MTDRPTNHPLTAQPSSWLRDRASSTQRWANRSLTMENFVSVMKTLAWVAPLTILIWIYAEREQEINRPATIPIAVKSVDPNRIVRLRSGDESISVQLVGPNASVERVTELVRRNGPDDLPAVQIEIGRQLPADGTWHWIDTAQYVADNPLFKSHGVTVRDCTPKNLQLLVDEITERDVEVRVPRNVTNLVSQPVFEPKTVRIRGPRSVIEATKSLTAEADLAGREELSQPGPHDIATLAVHASADDPSITVIPNTVHATIEVGQSDKRLLIPSIPIWASGPPGPPALLEKYKADYNPVLTNITLIGPPDKIALFTNNPDMQPIATLYVKREDIGKPMQDRRVTLNLPEGIYVAKEDEARLHVSFKLVELTGSE